MTETHQTNEERERARHEKEFFDQQYKRDESLTLAANPVMLAKYSQPSDMADWRQRSAVLLGNLKGCRLLDYGCGIGEESTYFALLGAEVHATEVSETALDLAGRRAHHNGIADRTTFIRVQSTRLPFADDFFDRVHGLGVLHHVGLDALTEIKRVLKPGGRAVFLEHMGSSRRLVPILRRLLRVPDDTSSQDEQPLDFRDVYQAGKSFSECNIYPYHILYRLRRFLPRGIHAALLTVDHALLRLFPFLMRYAGGAVILFVKPPTSPCTTPPPSAPA